jgi:hypothetical protein
LLEGGAGDVFKGRLQAFGLDGLAPLPLEVGGVGLLLVALLQTVRLYKKDLGKKHAKERRGGRISQIRMYLLKI